MTEFQPLLQPQSLVKVVLNGGHHELDDATIPFTVGMHESIAERQPTHVLVIDIPHQNYINRSDLIIDIAGSSALAYQGERTIYELRKIEFIQFKRSGKHNLIFILFKNLTKKLKATILQKENFGTRYQNAIWLNTIQMESNVVGYCEELVEIPEHFFALVPEKGVKKIWWKWVNRWFLTKPVDECEFRKRAAVALTIQPFAWFVGFLLRLIYSVLLTVFTLGIHTIGFISGQQPINQFKKLKVLWLDFLLLFRKKEWEDVLSFSKYWFNEKDYREYKHWKLFGKEIKLYISPLGAAIQLCLWSIYFLFIKEYWNIKSSGLGVLFITLIAAYAAVWHIAFVIDTIPHEKVKEWVKIKFTEKASFKVHMIAFSFFFITITCFLITQVPWIKVGEIISSFWGILSSMIVASIFLGLIYGKKITRWLKSLKMPSLRIPQVVYEQPVGGTVTGEIAKRRKLPIARADWLKKNMSIDALPTKVDLKDTAAPTAKERVFLKFKVSFWRAKSKVCRPYAK